MRLSYTIFELQLVIRRKWPILTYPTTFGAPQGVIPFEFRHDLWREKIRVPVLSCSIICLILRLAVLIQYWSVTDTHTHTHTHTHKHTTTAYTALA